MGVRFYPHEKDSERRSQDLRRRMGGRDLEIQIALWKGREWFHAALFRGKTIHRRVVVSKGG